MIHEIRCTFHEELIASVYFNEICMVDSQTFVLIFFLFVFDQCESKNKEVEGPQGLRSPAFKEN